MRHSVKNILFSLERIAARMLGLVIRPFRPLAKGLFVFLVSMSKISPWVSMLSAPFFLELGRVGLDRNGPLVCNYSLMTGAKMCLDFAEKNQRNLYFPRVYEEGLTRFVISSLRAGEVFIDVGANVGYFTLIAASLGARVLSIEPDKDNFALLTQNVQLNGYTNVELLHTAIGDHEGTATLHVNPLNRGGNSLLEFGEYFTETHGYSRAQIEQMYKTTVLEREVRLTTMDKIVEEKIFSSIAIMKIDVEGFEKPVLEGMKKTLQARIIKNIICELGNKETMEATLSLLRSCQYQAYSVDQEGTLTTTLGRDVVFRAE